MPGVCSNSCPLRQWYNPTITSSVVPLSFCLQSCPASRSHGPQPCLIQWKYEPCYVRPPKMDGSWCWVLTKHGPLEKGMTNNFSSILALRTPWAVWNTWACSFIFITLYWYSSVWKMSIKSDFEFIWSIFAVSRPSSVFFFFFFTSFLMLYIWIVNDSHLLFSVFNHLLKSIHSLFLVFQNKLIQHCFSPA